MTEKQMISTLKELTFGTVVGSKGVEAIDMAIQALSQEPTEKPMTVDEMEREYEKSKALFHKIVECDDAISREDAEQMFRNIRSHLKPQDYKSAEEFNTRDLMLLNAEQMIHALPSVTQKSGKWIPVSERLPEDNQEVLVYCEDGYWIVTFYDYNDGEVFWDDYGGDMYEEPIAWMPLPKPYELQESEDKG